MKKISTIVLIGILMLSISGCGEEPVKDNEESVVKVETKQVVEAFGTVKSTDVKTITIDFPALVSKINVVEGQRVSKGDVLLSLDSQTYLTQIRNKELDLKMLQIELTGLNRDYKLKCDSFENNTDSEIMRYKNDKNHAQDLLNKALEDLKARETLYFAGALSLNELNEFKQTVNLKEKAVADAVFLEENTRKKIQQELDQLQTSMEQKSLQVTSKELELNAMQEKMNKSYIHGNDIISDVPSGVVTDIGCTQGDIITDPEKKVLTVLNKDSLLIEANVAEEFIRDVKLDADVIINPQADKSKTYKGKVLFIAEKAVLINNETVIPVRISIDNPDNFLFPGFNVDVEISFENRSSDKEG